MNTLRFVQPKNFVIKKSKSMTAKQAKLFRKKLLDAKNKLREPSVS